MNRLQSGKIPEAVKVGRVWQIPNKEISGYYYGAEMEEQSGKG